MYETPLMMTTEGMRAGLKLLAGETSWAGGEELGAGLKLLAGETLWAGGGRGGIGRGMYLGLGGDYTGKGNWDKALEEPF